MEEENKTPTAYGKRPLWQWVIIYLVVAVLIYGLVYYLFLAKKGGSYNQGQTTQQAPTNAMAQPNKASSSAAPLTGAAMVQKINVYGTEFAFNPSTMTVSKDQSVQITFRNDGKYPHNLTIPDLNVKTNTIQPGQTDTITFTPTKVGQFGFLCTVPGHADKGMKGTLTVQ